MTAPGLAILAVETSTPVCSVALLVGEDLMIAEEIRANRHSESLLPMIESLLQQAGLSLQQLDALAVGQGPGSFTGIRIGIAAVQGLAFATGIPVVPVSSLASLAVAAGAAQVLAAIDARMQQVYWGSYRVDQSVESGLTARLVGQELVSNPRLVCPPDQSQWTAAGSAWAVYSAQLPTNILQQSGATLLRPTAGATAQLAATCFRNEGSVSADLLVPAYLRNKVANKKSA